MSSAPPLPIPSFKVLVRFLAFRRVHVKVNPPSLILPCRAILRQMTTTPNIHWLGYFKPPSRKSEIATSSLPNDCHNNTNIREVCPLSSFIGRFGDIKQQTTCALTLNSKVKKFNHTISVVKVYTSYLSCYSSMLAEEKHLTLINYLKILKKNIQFKILGCCNSLFC